MILKWFFDFSTGFRFSKDAFRLRQKHRLFPFTSGLPQVKGKINSQTSNENPFGFPTSHKWRSHKWRVGNQNGPWVTSLGIIPVTSPQPRGIIIPIVSENLPFKVKRKALAMPSGQNDRHLQWFLLKGKALPMPSGQNESIANSFRSKWRHCQCLQVKMKAWQISLTKSY